MHLRGTALQQLSGEQFEQLVKRLIDAERVASGLEPGDQKALAASNHGDGGIDCLLTRGPLNPTDFFRRGPLLFQFKKSYASWRPTDLAGPARTWLRRGAGYRLVVTDDLKPDLQVKRARSLKARVAKHVGRAVPDVSLVTRDDLFRWLSEHPSLWSYVPGMAPLAHLRSWEQWCKGEIHPAGPLPWIADKARTVGAERLRRGLEKGDAWRVTGPPGVGKTRFVLETLRELGPTVSYLPRYSDGVLDLVSASTPLYGTLVIDQCTEEQDRTIRRLRRATALAVVTIGPEEDATAEPGDATIRLEALDHEATERLASVAAPHVPLDVRSTAARHSGGYPQLIRLFLDAVAAAPQRGLAGVPLQRKELIDLLSRYLSPSDDDRALSALSLPAVVSFDRDSDDVEVLSTAFGIREPDLDIIRRRLEQRGAIGVVGSSVYVTPRLLGDWLALRAWRSTQPRRLLERLKAAGAREELIARCLRRLDLTTKESEEVMLDLASEPEALVRAVGAERVGVLASRLAALRPVEVVRLCERLLQAHEPGLSKISWSPSMARALARAAWFEEAFDQAARILARASTDLPGEHGRLFSDLFAARTGQTRAHWNRRLEMLRVLAADPGPAVRRLAAICSTAACQSNSTFALSDLPDRGERPWRIPTQEEDREYRLGAAQVLTGLMSDLDEGVRALSRHSVAAVLRELVRDRLAMVSVALVKGLVEARPNLAELEAAREVLHVVEEYDVPKLPPAEQAAVEQIHALLRPTSVADLVSSVLARRRWTERDEIDPELDVVAVLLVSTADPAALDHLFQTDPRGFELGRRVGIRDRERRLLEPIRLRAEKTGATLRFAAGYLCGLSGAPTSDDLLDSWSQDPTLADLVFETTWLEEPSDRAAARMLGMVERGALPKTRLGELQAGAWLSKVTRQSARRVLRAAMGEPKVAFVLAFQLAQLPDGSWVVPELKDAWAATGASVVYGDHLAWEWCEAGRMLARSELGFVANECLRLLRLVEIRNVGHVAELLGELLGEHPESIWVGFGDLMEQLGSVERQVLGMRMRAHLGNLPALTDQIVQWARRGDEHRRECAALLVEEVSEHPGNLGAALLDAFPDDRTVRRKVANAFGSGLFSGDESEWHGERLETLQRFARSGRPGLSRWARELIDQTRAEQKQAQQIETARRAGALEVPFHSDRPILDRLHELALVQQGFFTTSQARRQGCSSQLLHKYVRSGKVTQAMRGVYRVALFPHGENEDLVAIWLHFDGEAVFSHTTALALHQLSTALPQKVHLTLPTRWSRRRLRLPEGVRVHHADLRETEWTQVGAVRVTTIERTIADCEAAGVAPEFISDARREAAARGLIPRMMSPEPAEDLP